MTFWVSTGMLVLLVGACLRHRAQMSDRQRGLVAKADAERATSRNRAA